MRKMYLGCNEKDLAESPYARFFNPEMAPFQDHIAEALLTGGVAPELMCPIEQAAEMNDAGYWPVENGYARTPDGAIRVFCLTDMPDVTPAMWDWWFSWHGSEPLRYKLWHPKAHVHVGWQDGRSDLTYYVGRSSNIVEYLGSERFNGSIGIGHHADGAAVGRPDRAVVKRVPRLLRRPMDAPIIARTIPKFAGCNCVDVNRSCHHQCQFQCQSTHSSGH